MATPAVASVTDAVRRDVSATWDMPLRTISLLTPARCPAPAPAGASFANYLRRAGADLLPRAGNRPRAGGFPPSPRGSQRRDVDGRRVAGLPARKGVNHVDLHEALPLPEGEGRLVGRIAGRAVERLD